MLTEFQCAFFSPEIRRLEKDFNSQRSHFEDEITCLKETVKYLVEKRVTVNTIARMMTVKESVKPILMITGNFANES